MRKLIDTMCKSAQKGMRLKASLTEGLGFSRGRYAPKKEPFQYDDRNTIEMQAIKPAVKEKPVISSLDYMMREKIKVRQEVVSLLNHDRGLFMGLSDDNFLKLVLTQEIKNASLLTPFNLKEIFKQWKCGQVESIT